MKKVYEAVLYTVGGDGKIHHEFGVMTEDGVHSWFKGMDGSTTIDLNCPELSREAMLVMTDRNDDEAIRLFTECFEAEIRSYERKIRRLKEILNRMTEKEADAE